jgi:hypothetical protein
MTRIDLQTKLAICEPPCYRAARPMSPCTQSATTNTSMPNKLAHPRSHAARTILPDTETQAVIMSNPQPRQPKKGTKPKDKRLVYVSAIMYFATE